MTNKELFYFTGKCLMFDEDPGFRQEIIDKIENDSIDLLKFVTLCSNHLILPVIYLKFKSHDIIKHLSDELSEFLKEVYDLNLIRNKQILEQLHEVTDILNKSNIYPVFLKGAGNLLDGLYSDIGERILGDIDFLVPEKDYILSAKLLQNAGYSDIVNDGSDYHYPAIMKPGVPAHLEIHRLPVLMEFKSWFNTEIIDKERKTAKSLNGCYVLSDKHKIIHNFIHCQLQNKGHINGIVSLRDIYDLYLLSKRFELKQTLPDIKSKQKAIAYFVFAGKALGLNKKFFYRINLYAWLFSTLHDLNHSSAAFYRTYPKIIYIPQRIFHSYIDPFIKSFHSKEIRQSVLNRLSDPKWYIAHVRSYITFFQQKNDNGKH